MEVKFKESLDHYKYLLMFDLASHNTGVCLWDIKADKPIFTETLTVNTKTELPASELLSTLRHFLVRTIVNYNIDCQKELLVVKEAMPTQLHGGMSTVQTFIALAKSHCVLDTLLYENNIPTYDYVGIYPITWHNLFRQELQLDKSIKITKELVHDYVINKYKLSQEIGLDESDAVYLCHAFIEKKWNNDIAEKIKEEKRHRKTLKAEYAIKSCDEEIRRLEGLKTLKK